jgi:patatin-like phospholipase/acyl hydrolase
MEYKINILSIDGGGARGIIPLTIINYLYNNNINVIEKYEYYSGSSVGVLIICMLLSPHLNIDLKDINKLKDEFFNLTTKIFSNSYYNMMKTLNGYIGPKYDNINMYNILKEYFGEMTISDLNGKLIIPLFDILSNEIIVIDTEKDGNFKVIDLIMASTAAPTYFKSYELEYNNKKYIFIDNGVITNT